MTSSELYLTIHFTTWPKNREDRSFSAFLLPLYQNESSCETIHDHSSENEFRLQFYFLANQTYFHIEGFAVRLVLKRRHNLTRKWPIDDTRDAQTELRLFILQTVPLTSWFIIIIYVSSYRILSLRVDISPYRLSFYCA